MREPIPSLTGLRFIAAMCVVLGHAVPMIVKCQDPPWLVILFARLSAEGMTLFFVLSGFVIYYNYAETIGRRGGLYNFFVARFARLYPLYAVAVSYDLLIKYSTYQPLAPKFGALPYYATLTQSWIYRPIGDNALIYQFGLMPQVAWSVSTEWFFYMAFPLAVLAIGKPADTRQRLIAAAVLVCSAVAGLAVLFATAPAISQSAVAAFGPVAGTQQDGFWRWLWYFSPYVRILEFALGCLTASIYMGLAPATPAEVRRGRRLTVAALASIALAHWAMFESAIAGGLQPFLQALHQNFGFAPSMALLIFCCARYATAFSRLMSARLVVLGGEASYSIYLLHFLVIDAFRYQVATVTANRILVGNILQAIVVVAAAVGIALVSWALIEVPARQWLRRMLTINSSSTEREKIPMNARYWLPAVIAFVIIVGGLMATREPPATVLVPLLEVSPRVL